MSSNRVEELKSEKFILKIQKRLNKEKKSDSIPDSEKILTIIEIFEPFLLKLIREKAQISIEEVASAIVGFFWGTDHFTDGDYLSSVQDRMYGQKISEDFGELDVVNHLLEAQRRVRK